MPSEQYHIAFSSYPEPGSEKFYELPEALREVLNNCAFFVEEVTASRSETIVSRLKCSVELEEYYVCEGEIELVHLKTPSEIHWKCRKCGRNSGIITDFEGCRWDLSDIPELHAQQFLYDKYDAVAGNQKILPDLPFDLTDREENREFFKWVESLDEDDRQEFVEMLTEKFRKFDQHLAAAFSIGLAPDELESLLLCEWLSPEGPMVLNEGLPFEDVEHTFFYRNARIFLLELLDATEFELTPSGNLKRKYVNRLLDKGRWLEGYVENVRMYHKVLNEMNVWQLHMIRILLQESGVIKKRKNKLKPVQKYLRLVEKEQAGKLYRRLFYTYFKKINISYMSRYEDLPFLQECMGFTLFRLHELADDWSLSADLLKKILLETVRLELLRSLRSEYERPEVRLESLVLRPLELFGLIKSRYDTSLKPLAAIPGRQEQFRKTALFDRFIEFRF